MNDKELEKIGNAPEKYSTKQYLQFKKLHNDVVLPCKVHGTDAGLDLTAISIEFKDDIVIYGTGIAVEVPIGYVGLIYPRSSIYKYDLILANHVGVIDSEYRGEIKFIFRCLESLKQLSKNYYNPSIRLDYPKIYDIGDRIGQLILTPIVLTIPSFVDELSDTTRNVGGFGSTGK